MSYQDIAVDLGMNCALQGLRHDRHQCRVYLVTLVDEFLHDHAAAERFDDEILVRSTVGRILVTLTADHGLALALREVHEGHVAARARLEEGDRGTRGKLRPHAGILTGDGGQAGIISRPISEDLIAGRIRWHIESRLRWPIGRRIGIQTWGRIPQQRIGWAETVAMEAEFAGDVVGRRSSVVADLGHDPVVGRPGWRSGPVDGAAERRSVRVRFRTAPDTEPGIVETDARV